MFAILGLSALGSIAFPFGVIAAQVRAKGLRRMLLAALLSLPGIICIVHTYLGAEVDVAPQWVIAFVFLFVFALPILSAMLFVLLGYVWGRGRKTAAERAAAGII
jgi:hypothetical protein